jgi:prophage antirepressor-like protein
MKTENWNGHDIRFVSIDGEWWAVLSDIAKALNLQTKKLNQRLKDEVLKKHPIKDSLGRKQETSIVNEFGIYEAIFRSNKQEAVAFREWVFKVIKSLREQTGLEGFQVFRMLDKEHQKEAMSYLSHALKNPVRVNFIKANTIANKAISLAYGYDKMLKKAEMTPQMLQDRQKVLEEVVNLMGVQDKYDLPIKISTTIYNSTPSKHSLCTTEE